MNPMLTLITPMYNEADCILENIEKVITSLESLNVSWEYILVDDGSTDNSYAIAKEALADRPNCRIIHYIPNRGRGYALRQGFNTARGEYVITTESDLSWGSGIISTLYNALVRSGDDVVIASTYLPEGGYENVPLFRRKLSSYGNEVLRRSFGGGLTMLSGMTRGYRREAIQSIYLEEDRKEIHLEIVSKAQVLGYRISEIPGKIHWTPQRVDKGLRSQLGIVKHVIPHILSSLTEGAFKVFFGLSLSCFLFGLVLMVFGLLNKVFLITEVPKPNIVTYGFIGVTLAAICALIGILSLQLLGLRKHIIHLQSQMKKLQSDKSALSNQAGRDSS